MAQRADLFASLEEMRDTILETMKETALLRTVAIEEEVLIRAENIDKTCAHALRQTKHIRGLLTHSATGRSTRRP